MWYAVMTNACTLDMVIGCACEHECGGSAGAQQIACDILTQGKISVFGQPMYSLVLLPLTSARVEHALGSDDPGSQILGKWCMGRAGQFVLDQNNAALKETGQLVSWEDKGKGECMSLTEWQSASF